MPLSRESERVIQFATEESERLGHRYIGTEHLFLGLLREEKGLAATILKSHGVTLNSVRALLSQHAKTEKTLRVAVEQQDALQSFIGALKAGLKDKVLPFFSDEALFIDAFGNRWQGLGALHKNFDELFAPYASRNAKFLFEDSFRSSEGVRIATLLWEDVPLPDKSLKHHVRMSIVMGKRGDELLIALIQVTPVIRL
jgi:ketosteroid isomerase-like protein